MSLNVGRVLRLTLLAPDMVEAILVDAVVTLGVADATISDSMEEAG
jgi:hypothetical protein